MESLNAAKATLDSKLSEVYEFFNGLFSIDNLILLGYMLPVVSLCMIAILNPVYRYVSLDFGETMSLKAKLICPTFLSLGFVYHRIYFGLVFGNDFVPGWMKTVSNIFITTTQSFASQTFPSIKEFFFAYLWC